MSKDELWTVPVSILAGLCLGGAVHYIVQLIRLVRYHQDWRISLYWIVCSFLLGAWMMYSNAKEQESLFKKSTRKILSKSSIAGFIFGGVIQYVVSLIKYGKDWRILLYWGIASVIIFLPLIYDEITD